MQEQRIRCHRRHVNMHRHTPHCKHSRTMRKHSACGKEPRTRKLQVEGDTQVAPQPWLTCGMICGIQIVNCQELGKFVVGIAD
jgi:hypothetical protein